MLFRSARAMLRVGAAPRVNPAITTTQARGIHDQYYGDRIEEKVYIDKISDHVWPMYTDEENQEKADNWVSYNEENMDNEFLVRVMRKLKMRRDADPKNYLVKRLPGSSPRDILNDPAMPKALHAHRLKAVREHLKERKVTAAIAYERSYRDLYELDLTLPSDAEDWKTDMLEGFRMELTKNRYWTTGQKERFLLEAKRRFTEDYDEKGGWHVWKWLVEDNADRRAKIEAERMKLIRKPVAKTNTRRKKKQR